MQPACKQYNDTKACEFKHPMSAPTPTTEPKPWADPTPADIVLPPCNLDSDEPPLESSLHLQQLLCLLASLNWHWRDRQDYFAAGNLTIYFSPEQVKTQDFRGPDFFVVLGTEDRPRKSWTVWEEGGLYPHVIVELLSGSTASNDRGVKKEIYQNTFRTPDYFWFDPESLEFCGFHLLDGQYQEQPSNEQGWRWSQQLQLYLGVQEGRLRFFTAAGELVLTPEEAALMDRANLEAALATVAVERQRREQLEAKLRELGIELPPDA